MSGASERHGTRLTGERSPLWSAAEGSNGPAHECITLIDVRVTSLPAASRPRPGPRPRRFQELTCCENDRGQGKRCGEAQAERDAFDALPRPLQQDVIAFLNSLILFPPDDTASNLDPGDQSAPGFPQYGHGSIKLTVLFNDPRKIE